VTGAAAIGLLPASAALSGFRPDRHPGLQGFLAAAAAARIRPGRYGRPA